MAQLSPSPNEHPPTISSYHPDDQFSSFSTFNHHSNLYSSPGTNAPFNSPDTQTCRFGRGFFGNDYRPLHLPSAPFYQLACSNCLVYVGIAKQMCDLEYDATPAGLLPRSLPAKRSCAKNETPLPTSPSLTSIDPFAALHTVSSNMNILPEQMGTNSTANYPIEFPRPIPIPESITENNFFCNELLEGNKAHCSLWRECCNAAISCCNEMIPSFGEHPSTALCPKTWDGILCWNSATQVSIQEQACPSYFKHESSSFSKRPFVFKNCTADGWYKNELDYESSNTESCMNTTPPFNWLMVALWLSASLHTLSIISLIVAICVFIFVRYVRLSRYAISMAIHKTFLNDFCM
jgi:hypothetical protein